MLDEDNHSLQLMCLTQLSQIVDVNWVEMSESISKIEQLFEDQAFPDRELAALVLSKLYYHLGESSDSLFFAIKAGSKLDFTKRDGYTTSILISAIDTYIQLRPEAADREATGQDPEAPRFFPAQVDAAGMYALSFEDLEPTMNRIFADSIRLGRYAEVIGVALESNRTDIIQQALAADPAQTLELARYAFRSCSHQSGAGRALRHTVYGLIRDALLALPQPDYELVFACLVRLGDRRNALDLLTGLLGADRPDVPAILQLCFDLYDSAPQDLLGYLVAGISRHFALEDKPLVTYCTSMKTAQADDGTHIPAPFEFASLPLPAKARLILSGMCTNRLNQAFLLHRCNMDRAALDKTREKMEQRPKALLTAVIMSHAIAAAGTARQGFLIRNRFWVDGVINWNRFSAVASHGVLHRGRLDQAFQLLSRWLPFPNGGPGPSSSGGSGGRASNKVPEHAEGGALYALGLIHTNLGQPVVGYLHEAFMNAGESEPILHGAALGLGIAAMGSKDANLASTLMDHLYTNQAVSGEAAALALGMIMLGSGDREMVTDLLDVARDTQHEKIIRGTMLAVAMIMHETEQEADSLVDELLADKDPLMRYGAVHTIAMAYIGTGNTWAIQRLLHTAVSDVNDDVRRSAASSLGFLLFRDPESCPRLVQLLSDSYNPHVRYGTAMALGMACAGTGSSAASKILDKLAADPVDLVRQAAVIGHAMVMQQQPESRAGPVRTHIANCISERHEAYLARFGAVIAQGILEAGGRNVVISLASSSVGGSVRPAASVGLLLFSQFWFWYPLINMLSMAFVPTGVILADEELRIPTITLNVRARPSQLAYPVQAKEEEVKTQTKVATAVLSTTHRAKARATLAEKARSAAASQAASMAPSRQISPSSSSGNLAAMAAGTSAAGAGAPAKMDVDVVNPAGGQKKVKFEEAEPTPAAVAAPATPEEPTSTTITNPARVPPALVRHVSLSPAAGSRFEVAAKAPGQLTGIVIVRERAGAAAGKEDVTYLKPSNMLSNPAPPSAASVQELRAFVRQLPGGPADALVGDQLLAGSGVGGFGLGGLGGRLGGRGGGGRQSLIDENFLQAALFDAVNSVTQQHAQRQAARSAGSEAEVSSSGDSFERIDMPADEDDQEPEEEATDAGAGDDMPDTDDPSGADQTNAPGAPPKREGTDDSSAPDA
ncbi:hypothetical protein H696_01366 [Fonticula alba]|uniref:Uncharacterized protein n=1 Tax=Fonticula alba TaxID=691883 RepID=A0A058ZET5_FONAL|nr:hypothetical protein H696_01366 [Fonticula alba]KCV71957.1 hypothetical protein H696_01366 [Fonticula alba]|eukprot:XP_009493535.1 hypothetical protein H696_01366 [Fonticula alba]